MTAPAFKAAGSIAVDVGSNVTVAWPTHVAGDYAILVSASFDGPPDSAPTLVTPAGFTLIGNVQGTAGNSTNLTLWWNYATSSAMASPVMPTQGLNAGGQGSSLGQIFTFSGAMNSAPDVTSFTGGTGTSLSANGATTTGTDRLVAVFASQYGLTAGAISVTGWTNASLASFAEQVEGSGAMNGFVNSGFNPSLQVLALATGSLAAAGTYGATTGTFSGGWASGGWSAATIALIPAPVVVVTPTLTPTFTMVAHSPPVSGTNNMLAQVSVGTGTFTTTSPPVAQQTASGLGIHPVPLPGNIALTDIVTNTGGTLTALQAGGGAFKWVFAIEGYPNLLTDANTAKAIIAWSGTDYTSALGGLFVELDVEQAINPHDPFANIGGTLTIRVQPDASDTFGIDTNRRAAGAEAKVIRSLDRNGASITIPSKHGNDVQFWPWIAVDNGLGFAAGDAWIGTECLTLNGPGQNNVSFSARGKYAPFASGGTGGSRFSQHHRVACDSNGVSTNPLLTQQPRTWVGRMVGLWMHKVNADGTLNAKTDAQCVFAGRISAISDDAETGFTSVQCTHFLDGLKSTTIGRDIWSATVAEGVYITTGLVFSLSDGYSGAAGKTANTLTVVASAAAGTNQINAGWYTLGEICDFLNTWIGAETVATRVYGSYRWASPVSSNIGFRTKCYWSIAGTANVLSLWALNFPAEVAILLGITQFSDAQAIAGTIVAGASGTTATATIYQGANPPMRESFSKQFGLGGFFFKIAVENERGVLQDQYSTLPANQKPPSSSGLVWGVFILNGKYILLGARDPSTSDTTLTNVVPLNLPLPGAQSTSDVLFTTLGRPADDTNAGPMTISQLFILDTTFAKLLKTLAYSTGTPNYNHPLYDTLGYGLGLALPNDILGAPFERTIDRLPGAQLPICVTVDKPLTFQELLGADLLMRRAFPVWRNGHIEMSQWTTPTADLATIALNEGNKAEPAASMSSQRSATILTDEWMKNVVQIHYNRDITDVSKEDYQNSLTLEDQRSVDDSGGVTAVLDIKARNTFVQLAGTGAGIEDLAPGYLALMPLFSQPVRKSTRSTDVRFYEGVAPGDQALVTDKFMRDPATGLRGVSARAAIITRARYNPGGLTAGKPDSVVGMQGEVDVFFLDLHRYGSYAPCADIDTTNNTAGFVNGYRASTLEIALLAHANSESADVADYTRFKAGDQVVIQQIDPDDPAVALSWSRRLTVAPSGNLITIDQALVGYDTTKLYRVTYDTYSRVQGLQQASVFQAADTTGRIQNVGYAYEWAATPELADTTANGVADAAELMPAIAYGDGEPLDAGNERGLLRAINAMVDYKAARCSPTFFDQTAFSYLNAPNYIVVLVRRIYLGAEQLTNSVFRYLSVAPWTRVTSDGSSGQLRVTLSRSSPERLAGTSLGSSQIQFNDQYDQVIFDAGTSATWWAPSRQLLSAAVKDSSGYAWLTIERIGRAESRGMALCQLGPRVVSV